MENLATIASAIYNHIAAGLKGTANEPYSIEQIIDEILVVRADIIRKEILSGRTNTDDYIETLSCIKLDCEDISMCCGIETYDKKLHFKLPKLAAFVDEPIKYIGIPDRTNQFEIIKGHTWNIPQFTAFSHFKKRKSTRVWMHPNREDGYIFDPPNEDLEVITVDFIPENPTHLYNYGCCPINNFEEDAKTIPNWMVDNIINTIVSRFSQTMYKFSYKRNDGTGH